MNLDALLSSFRDKRVLVIGDLIVDITTRVERIKDDNTGKPTYRAILDHRGKADKYSFGGAALVVRNLLALGAKVDFITATGYGAGALAAETFHLPGMTKHAVKVAKPQTVKHRYVCNGEKVLQVDIVDNTVGGLPDFGGITDRFDAVVVADYRHGLISEASAKEIVSVATWLKIPLYVSSQVAQAGSNHDWYDLKGGPCFVMNELEYEKANFPFAEIGYPFRKFVVTRSSGGATRFGDLGPCHSKAIEVNAIDTCGAGDAFLATYCLTGDLKFANTWAGLSCTVEGPNPPTLAMLRGWYEKHEAERAPNAA